MRHTAEITPNQPARINCGQFGITVSIENVDTQPPKKQRALPKPVSPKDNLREKITITREMFFGTKR